MFCPKCGKENPEQSKFCQGCGVPLAGGAVKPAAPASPTMKKTQFPLMVIAAGVAILVIIALVFALRSNFSSGSAVVATAATKNLNPKVILLIAEQNIEGPQRAWWVSEIDLSTVEAGLAQKLMQQGYQVLEPSQLERTINQSPAFQLVGISEGDSVKLGNLSKAQYVVLGKAVASAGGNVPQSSMRSCYANVTAKLIRVKDGKVIAYLDAAGNSVHTDVITGGREALANAADDLAAKISDAMNKDSGG